MKQIQFNSGRVVFDNTVGEGEINSELLGANTVDDIHIEIYTEFGTYTFDHAQIQINGIQPESVGHAVSLLTI